MAQYERQMVGSAQNRMPILHVPRTQDEDENERALLNRFVID
jgi:hypothetical protein